MAKKFVFIILFVAALTQSIVSDHLLDVLMGGSQSFVTKTDGGGQS